MSTHALNNNATLSRWLPLTGRSLGIPARMVRATASSVAAMLMLDVVILLGPPTIDYFSTGDFNGPDQYGIRNAFIIAGAILALVMGLLCGGEDEENGTADFLQRLPIHPLRLLTEKLAGCAIAFAIWFVLTLVVSVMIAQLQGYSMSETFHPFWEKPFPYRGRDDLFSMGLLLFGFGMVSAAWIGKLIPAALVAGGLYIAYLFMIFIGVLGYRSLYELYNNTWPTWVALLGFALCLAATAARAITREGR